jgi:Carboxypeptidase regulatory-like domain
MRWPTLSRLALLLFLLGTTVAGAQTFRGGISGRITDPSGAVLPGVAVTATNDATGVSRSTVTSTTGDFSLPDLPLGTYTVEAKLEGFQPQQATVEVTVSKVSAIDLKLGVSQLTETLQVSATGTALDLQSTALANVVQPKQVQDLPLNGRDFRRMLQLAPGVTQDSSVNGVRTRGNNFQIDGADNNDAFQNTSAVNQGGVSGIAGTLLPVEAIDQFSVQSSGSAEVGRSAGSTVNLVIKSGTNSLHGSAFYFNRNEALAAQSPIVAPGSPKRPIRNNQFGFSIGGPIVQNRTFFFGTFEGQKLIAGNTLATTAPSDAWISQAKQMLSDYGVAVNPVALNLLSLWPKASLTGPATANNFVSTDQNTYDSYNGIAKIDHTFNERYSLSGRYFGGNGDQTAYDGGSPFLDYYQTVPSRMHNVSIVPSMVISPHLVNQVVFGYNYFYQTFNSNSTAADPIGLGLNTGSSISGAPVITISGFGQVGGTSPLGRIDTTYHLTDTLSYSTASHQVKMGGEVRRANLDIFYDTSKRGSFSFDGTVGPWKSSTATAAQRALADFLAGDVSTATILRGPTRHQYYQNSFDLYAHDTWTLNQNVTINYGVRYTYQGVLGASDQQLTTFFPDRGLVSVDQLYPKDWNNLAPRAGITWTPDASRKTVVRGAYGVYYDVIPIAYFAANTGWPSGNGGALGVGHNPGGANPVYTITQRGITIANGVPVFGDTLQPPYGAFSVSQDLQLPYVQSFNVNVERQIGSATVVQVGYVGTRGSHLAIMRDINAAAIGTTGTLQSRRPYNALYPTLGAIDQMETAGKSRYNGLQISAIQRPWHGLSGRANYTFAHSQDTASEARNTLIMDATNVGADWADSDFDVRHIFSAGFSYDIPAFMQGRFGEGWQLNTIITLESGRPFNIRTGTNVSGAGDFVDRAVQVGDAFSDLTGSGLFPRFFTASAFANPTAGTFSTLERNAFHGPSFKTVDLSLFKTTKLTGSASVQLRLEAFNIFNTINWANPGSTLSSSTTFGLLTNTRNGSNAPGIGAGEPRNVQLAVKFLF